MKIVLDSVRLTLHGMSDEQLKEVDAATSYPIKNAYFSTSFRSKRWDGQVHLMTYSRKSGYRVYTGCLGDIVTVLGGEDKVEVIDQRVRPPGDCDHGWTGQLITPDGELVDLVPRDYQVEAVKHVVSGSVPDGRCMLKMPVRSGKTVTAGLLIGCLQVKTLFLVTSDILLNQTIRLYESMFSVRIGKIGDGVWEPSNLTVATIQTINARSKEDYCKALLDSCDLVLFDECFPAGTDVGGRPIEKYQIGDNVVSGERETSIETVTHVFKKRPSSLVSVRFKNGSALTCTPNHPIWTQRGWIEAGSLLSFDVALRSTSKEIIDASQVALREVQLPRVQRAGDVIGERQDQRQDKGEGILLGGLQAEVGEATLVGNGQGHQRKIQGAILREDERGQEPYEESGHQSQGEHDAQSHGLEADHVGREWTATDNTAGPDVLRPGVADGSYCFDGEGRKGQRTSDALQARHRQRDSNGGNRGGWGDAQESNSERAGPEERQFFEWVGVDRIEVLEQGSDGTFGGLCPDGFVYNIETTGPHTYFADGFLVHNCHHLKADKWKEIALRIPAYWKVGLSATIFLNPKKPNERENVWLKACTGNIAYEISIGRLIEEGWLVRPTIEMYRYKTRTLGRRPGSETERDEEPDWTEDDLYGRGIVSNTQRNRIISHLAVEAVQRDNSMVMIMAQRHEHIDTLYDLVSGCGVKAEKLTGKVTGMKRKGVLARFKDRRTTVLIGNVFGEGLDIPEMDVVINAEGGESSIRAIQRMRNLTPSEGKDHVRVIDFWDEGNRKYLLKHSRRRMAAYKSESAFNIKELDFKISSLNPALVGW